VDAGVVQLGHDVADRLADPGKLAQPVLGDNAVERLVSAKSVSAAAGTL
jgi:hypothetical protein